MQVYNLQVRFLKNDVAVVTGQATIVGGASGKTTTVKIDRPFY